MKKIALLMLSLLVLVSFAAPDEADARRSFKSPKSTYSNTPSQSTTNTPAQSNISRTDSGQTKSNVNSTAATTGQRGFFSGGGLLKGLMIGGLAGLLFGSLFASLGVLGNILGLIVNLLALYVLVMLAVALYRYVKNRREVQKRY